MQIKLIFLRNNNNGDYMHNVNISSNIHTDLVYDNDSVLEKEKAFYKNIKVFNSKKDNYNYTTITFNDITDKDNYLDVQNIFINELRAFLSINKNDIFLIIGLGNSNSTPDSLGPKVIDNILVTRYLFLLGEVEEGYSNVCSFSPNVMGNTGIETADIIESIINNTKATKVIVIDALKTCNLERLTKTIQITNRGIAPGSGIGNTRKEISKKTMNVEIIAIGIPTVVDIREITKKKLIDNFIVTPTSIDFIIEKLSTLIGNGINICLHKNYIRQNNYY